MSGRYPDLLKRRAESMMRLAERLLSEGEYDLAVLNAEYAARLYVKSVLLRLTGEEWKGHGVRTLLGAVALATQGGGLRDVAEEIVDFTRRSKRCWLSWRRPTPALFTGHLSIARSRRRA